MIQKLSLNTQMIWMAFIRILQKAIQILIIFDDMITGMLSNRKFNPIVTEVFIRRTKQIFQLL